MKTEIQKIIPVLPSAVTVFFTLIILVFGLFSFGQTNTPNDSSAINPPDIKVTLLAQVFLNH